MVGALHYFVIEAVNIWGVRNGYKMDRECREFQDLEIHPFRPDGKLTLKEFDIKKWPIIYIEAQGVLTKEWREKIETNYAGSKVIVIELKQVKKAIEGKVGLEVLDTITDFVRFQMELESYKPPRKIDIPKTKIERKKKKVECQYCGKEISLLNIYGHEYACRLNPRNKKVVE